MVMRVGGSHRLERVSSAGLTLTALFYNGRKMQKTIVSKKLDVID